MSVASLPYICGGAVLVVLTALVVLLVGLRKRRRPMVWGALACLVAGSLGGYTSYTRLERIHGQLFRWEAHAKTKSELLAQLGRPSRTDTYLDKGKTIEVWFYDITMLQPVVHVQFEMYHDDVVAVMGSNL